MSYKLLFTTNFICLSITFISTVFPHLAAFKTSKEIEEILDIDDHPLRKSSCKLGFSFSPIQRIGAAVFFVVAFVMVFQQNYLGIALSLFFAFIFSANYGFQIDAAKGRFREYSEALLIKRGDWKNLAAHPFVAILKSQKGHTTDSRSNRTVTTTETSFEIYLLSETHRTKVQIAEFKDLEKAKSFAKKFATVVEKKLTTYSPQISSSSKRRR